MQNIVSDRAEQDIADLSSAFAPTDDHELKGLIVGDFADRLPGRAKVEAGIHGKAGLFKDGNLAVKHMLPGLAGIFPHHFDLEVRNHAVRQFVDIDNM